MKRIKSLLPKVMLSFLLIITLFTLSGCINSAKSYSNNHSDEVVKNEGGLSAPDTKGTLNKSLSNLATANRVVIKKSLISFGNKYTIKTEDGDRYTIKGKFVNLTGDTFTLKDDDGNVLGKEKQIKRWGVKLNRLAKIMDFNGKIIGYIGEERIGDMLKIGYRFHFYDQNGKEIGYTKQKLISLALDNKIYNKDGTLAYKINGKLLTLTSKYEINAVNPKDINMVEASYFACILNEIYQARKDAKK